MSDTRNWIGFFLLGTINNLPYVIVNSAANTIADRFHESNLIGLVFGANVSLALIVKGLNTFCLLNVPYGFRFGINGCLMLGGLFGVAYAYSFYMALAFIVIVGSSAAFGENVSLGFLSHFPSKMVNAWSSGTGMAGLLGSTIYIIFGCTVGNDKDTESKLEMLTRYAFLCTTPVVVIYWLSYFFIIDSQQGQLSRNNNRSEPEAINYGRGDGQSVNNNNQEEQGPDMHGALVAAPDDGGHGGVADRVRLFPTSPLNESFRGRIWRSFKIVGYLSVNLCLVYVFEYVARGCAAKARPKEEYHSGCPELYAGLQLCYQAGVFVSRSSIHIIKITRLDILTAIQFLNMMVWIFDVHYKFLPVVVLPAFMVFVGLLGGAAYVNIFYTLLNSHDYPEEDRELCINIVAIFITFGIIIGTGVETVLFLTVLKDD